MLHHKIEYGSSQSQIIGKDKLGTFLRLNAYNVHIHQQI